MKQVDGFAANVAAKGKKTGNWNATFSQLFLLPTDIIDRSELKTFFESNCSQIYFIFYENFTTLESSLKQKGGSARCSLAGWNAVDLSGLLFNPAQLLMDY